MNKSLKLFICGTASLLMAMPAEAMELNTTTAPVPAAKNKKQRSIIKVESIYVESPVGTCPRLPYQVLVTYSDKKQEWRQTR